MHGMMESDMGNEKELKIAILMKLMKVLHSMDDSGESSESPQDESAESPEEQKMEDAMGTEQQGKPKGIEVTKEKVAVLPGKHPMDGDLEPKGDDDLEKLKKSKGYLGKM